MRRTLFAFVTGAVLVTALGACEPTNDPRCDSHLAPILEADKLGYRIDCEPPWVGPLGWAEHDTRTLWVDADRITHDGGLVKVMWHEVGHAAFNVAGRTFPTQQAEECAADAYAYSKMTAAERSGVGFLRCT